MIRDKKKDRTLTGNLERRYWAGLMQLNKRESTAFGPPSKGSPGCIVSDCAQVTEKH